MISGCFLKQSIKFLLFSLLIFLIVTISWVGIYKWINPPISALMALRAVEYKSHKQSVSTQRKWINLGEISLNLITMVLAAEDHSFLEHPGYDWKKMKYAYKNFKKKKSSVGFSTISQQTAKNLFLFPAKTYLRKGLELYFTILMEKILDKKRIFELYINYAELGYGIYGFEAASEQYFHKSSADLSLDEACLLTTLLTSPRRFSLFSLEENFKRRYSHIYFMVSVNPQFSIYAQYLKGCDAKNYLFKDLLPKTQRSHL